ncbi:MAG: ATP-binding cassette domain-containing protein, partial [Bacteroidaceae bacterium]|nr:ATP-binding cassette domain-containing protein [Bacteroidaceae bacterium]
MTIDYRKIQIYQGRHKILADVDFRAQEGEMIYLIGPVGSGKTSLLKTIYGEIECEGECAKVLDADLLQLHTSQLPALRRQMGMVFQDFKLLPDYSVYYNLNYILRATGWKNKAERDQRI